MIKKILKRLGITLLVLFLLLNVIAAFHAYKFTHYYHPTATSRHKNPLEMTGTEKLSVLLFGTKFYRKPVVDSFPLPHETIEIKTKDGLILEGWYIQKPNAKGTVIMFHGHGGNRAGITNEALAFHEFGYNVYSVDFRAHGNSEGNICTIGYKETADVKAAYDFVSTKGEKNIILYGISLGAATITKTLHDYKELQPSKIILEMPFGSLLEAVKGRVRMMGLPEQPISTLLTFWGGTEQAFWAFNHEPAEFAKSIKVPTLVQWGKNDVRVTEAETKAVFNNISSANKQMVVYEESGHQSLLSNEGELWRSTVSAFLEKH